jgi:polysaccharide biosynthesis/export protein
MNRNPTPTNSVFLKLIYAIIPAYFLCSTLALGSPGTVLTESTLPEVSSVKESPVIESSKANNISGSEPNGQTTKNTDTSSSAPATDNQEASPLANYLLSPGDTLIISVWKEEGLQEQQYVVAPDGAIIFPLIGTISAAGKTTSEMKEIITNKLADYISDPSVMVKLVSSAGNTIFVIGKVAKPGQYYTQRKIDVLQALSLAGGISVFASEDSISIQRRTGSGNDIKIFPFDYNEVIKGENLQQNILLEPGDTVTVP